MRGLERAPHCQRFEKNSAGFQTETTPGSEPPGNMLWKIEQAVGLFGFLGAGRTFTNSSDYWDKRYSDGRTSGMGSQGAFARMKADFINDFVREREIGSVVDFGAGDGNQLRLLDLPDYTGLDVSRTTVHRLSKMFHEDSTKRFLRYHLRLHPASQGICADLGLSLDVIYHLVEDRIFEAHMRDLFACSRRWVIIYSSNVERPPSRTLRHVRDREFTRFIDEELPEWELDTVTRNPLRPLSRSDFFVFRKKDSSPPA